MRAMLAVLAVVLVASQARAASGDNVFQWTGPDGKTYFGDLPPADARNIEPMRRRFGTSSAAVEPTPAADVPEDVAECANKRKQLETYRNATSLIEKDALGREREYTAEERELLIAKTQEFLDSNCSDAAP